MKYTTSIELETEECCKCGMAFAMTSDFMTRRRKDHNYFYCPDGHGQYYTGKTEEQKLKDKLALKEGELQREQGNVIQLKKTVKKVATNYQRMRDRVKNGVCPCCDRTFQNLLNHMKTQHPAFGSHRILKTLRTTYGLSQSSLADEIGISVPHISNFERQKPVPGWVNIEIENWIAQSA